jgi:hypothetical protein
MTSPGVGTPAGSATKRTGSGATARLARGMRTATPPRSSHHLRSAAGALPTLPGARAERAKRWVSRRFRGARPGFPKHAHLPHAWVRSHADCSSHRRNVRRQAAGGQPPAEFEARSLPGAQIRPPSQPAIGGETRVRTHLLLRHRFPRPGGLCGSRRGTVLPLSHARHEDPWPPVVEGDRRATFVHVADRSEFTGSGHAAPRGGPFRLETVHLKDTRGSTRRSVEAPSFPGRAEPWHRNPEQRSRNGRRSWPGRIGRR